MSDQRQPYIINASTNLLGICFVIITGLKLTRASEATIADELCIVASIGFMTSCIFAYLSLRTEKNTRRYETIADYVFVASMLCLFAAVLVFAGSVF
ncbi:MAG TPA: hypothetical protein VGO34_08725 [Alphaproteobacteria bacterium]|jgi:hypothetical protein